jgi:hypothetical protein
MKGEVDVLGNLNYLEVWNHARFLEKLEQEPDHGRRREDARPAWDLILEALHTPVLAEEAVHWLAIRPGGNVRRRDGGPGWARA